MEKDILVSIVIPTYSRNTTLERAIDSALSQTYENIEIIVVDDNPPDSKWRISTQHLMQQYEDNPKVHYIQNVKNMGGSGARNEGIKASRGEYIAFLDDDDEYLPEKVEKQLMCFLSTDLKKLALVFCDAIMTYDNDKFVCYVRPRYKGCCLYEAMINNCLAATSQWMAKKEALLDVGMFTIVFNKQDSTLILKLLDKGYQVDCVTEVLSKYCAYDGQRISNISIEGLKGEIAYMNRCRKLFYKLSENQIENVELAFAKKLYNLYGNLRMYKKMHSQFKKMLKITKVDAIYYVFTHMFWEMAHLLKVKVKKIGGGR